MMPLPLDRTPADLISGSYLSSLDSFKSVGLLSCPDENVLNGVQDKDVAVVKLFPIDGMKLTNDGLAFALHDEQLRLLLVVHHVQAGGDATVQDSGGEKKRFWVRIG